MDDASSTSQRDPLERLAAEFLDRRRRGEGPSPADYADLHPELADQILEFFPALEVMEGLKPASGDPTGSLGGQLGAAVTARLERLGEYRILREIGHGGMGVVYEAVQESLGRRVALKILPLHGRVDPVQIERFRLESRSAARLHHGHIVPVYGMGEHDGVYYYAMQYIQGHGLDVILEDLRRLRAGEPAPAGAVADRGEDAGSMSVARSLLTGRYESSNPGSEPVAVTETQPGDSRGPRPEAHEPVPAVGRGSVLSQPTESGYYRTVARLSVQVAQALAHAHSQGVLHRDIKPSNLLLDATGHVWVADFGLAKVEGSDGPTHTGDIVGTLRYMAPERFEGWSDRRSDIYGLGMSLFELLTLRSAFEAATRAKLIDRVIHEPPMAPRRYDPRIPRDIETIVLKAIDKEPGERYATAEALAADLENYLADRPILVRRNSPAELAWRWCRRNKAEAALLAASAVAALALVGVIVGSIDNARVRSSERAAVSARQAEEVERKKAEAAVEREQRLGYIHQIVLAEREWSGNNMPRAEQLLDECPPDRRGWEWRYLKRLCHAEILTLAGHEGEVRQAAFSPDGRQIATCGADRIVKLWDAATGRMIRSFDDRAGRINSIAYSPDGRRLASVSGDAFEPGRLVLWDAETGTLAVEVSAPAGFHSRVVFSADGRRLAIASGELNAAHIAQIRDASTGAVLRTIDVTPAKVLDLAFSPDGLQLAGALGSYELFEINPGSEQVRVWDPNTGNELFRLDEADRPLIAVAWSPPDGRQIASAGWDQVVNLWDVKARRKVSTLRGHRDLVNGIAFSHDGRRVVSSSDDSSAKIWDASSGQEILTLRGHRSSVNSVAFSPDDRRVVTASDDRTAKLWDVSSGRESLSLRGHRGWVTSVDFHPDDRTLLSAGVDLSLRVWDASTGRMSRELSGATRPVWRAVYSPDGRWIASGGGDWSRSDEPGEVILWDAQTGRIRRSWKAHHSVAWCVVFSPDGRLLASSGGELSKGPGDIVVRELDSGRERLTIALPGHSGIFGIAFSPDGRRLASTGEDGLVRLWDTESGHAIQTLAQKAPLRGVAFDHQGERLVSAGQDNCLVIWDLTNGEQSRKLVGHTYYVVNGVFSRDGRRVVSTAFDRSLKVWDVETGQELLTLRGHEGATWGVAISADGQRIASSGQDGVVRIWDATPRATTRAGDDPVVVPTGPPLTPIATGDRP